MTREEGSPFDELSAPASPEEIATEELALKAPFPESLKRFLLRHNGGCLYDLVQVYSVGPPQSKQSYTFEERNRYYASDWDFASTGIAFAEDGGLGVYYFDSATRGADGECDIFYWSYAEGRAEPVGRTFEDFLRYVKEEVRLMGGDT